MILNNTLVKEIIKRNYDLGEIISLNPLESGHESDNVKVTTEKGEYVLKYFPRESESFRETMILQDLLFTKGVKLPQLIKTITNEFAVKYSPTETIAIQSFIPGKAIVFRDEDPDKMFSLMNWFGKHLGEFHFISKSIKEFELRKRITREDFFDLTTGMQWVKEQYDQAETTLPPHKKNELILQEFEVYLKEMNDLFSNNMSQGIIQSDLKPGDFFTKNNELTGILDFNGASYSYLINELGTWVMYTSLYKPENKTHFQEFIKSYLKHSKIPIQELHYIPLLLKGRAFIQYFYFTYRIYNNITQGLSEGETNMKGFEDGIHLVEASLKTPRTYFYDLAVQVLEEQK